MQRTNIQVSIQGSLAQARRSRRPLSFSLLALCATVISASCGGSTTHAQLAKGCTINSDCDSPLVCAFQTCHKQCDSSRDCLDGALCVSAVRPLSVCQLESESLCSYNSQCVQGEICAVDGKCRDQCVADRDCLEGQVCASGACANPKEVSKDGTLPAASMDGGTDTGTPCQLSSDCGDTGLVCRQGYCAVQCKADIDCVAPNGPGGSCIDNRCQGTSSGLVSGGDSGAGGNGAGGNGATGGELPAGYGKACNLPSDCDSSLKCGASGQCVYECNASTDCAADGACCVGHQCATGAACAQGNTGGTGSGGAQSTGTCKPCVQNSECDDALYCNGQEQCYAGCCAPALDTPCNSHSACIIDSCDEKTHKCSNKTVAAEDVDGDGHLAFGCSGGDDCNDADPTVFTGHAEAYDGKDNDCNGFIDDWTSEPKGPTSPALVSASNAGQLGAAVNGGPGAWLASNFAITLGGPEWLTTPFDNTWSAGTLLAPVLPLIVNSYAPLDGASGPNGACFIIHNNSQVQAVVIDATGALLREIQLGATASGSNVYAQVTWTGSNYLAGWNDQVGGNSAGFFSLVDSGGNLLGTHNVPGSMVDNGSTVGVASNGTSLAVAWKHGPISLAIMNTAGGVTGTVDIYTPTDTTNLALYAVAGVPAGYVVLWSLGTVTNATYVPALNGQPGTPKTVIADATHVPSLAKGNTDGPGAAFLIQYGAVGVSFGYLNGSMKNPFELSSVAPGAALADIAGGSGGRFGLFYTQNAQFYGRQAGYASLTGTVCAQDSNCTSGKCKAVVATGPKAYSTCQ